MADRSATALLGMDGFVVLSHSEEAGELWMLVETTADVVGCPRCGVRGVGHGRSVVQLRDVPMAGRAVRLVWRRRRWRCSDPDCSMKTFTENPPAIEGLLTRRAAKEICRQVGEDGRSVAEVANAFGVSWHSAMAAVRRHGEPPGRRPPLRGAAPPHPGLERLSERQVERLLVAMRRGDPYDELGGALVAKEVLRQMYTAQSPAEAREDLAEFYAVVRRSEVSELSRLARTVKRWEPEILSFFATGHTNAKSEAMNLITEKLRRVAHGMRNFENYRLRLLLHSGVQWQTAADRTNQGRHPRLVA